MTQQDFVDQNIRMLLGDLQLQIILLRARIQELEQKPEEPDIQPKANGGLKREESVIEN